MYAELHQHRERTLLPPNQQLDITHYIVDFGPGLGIGERQERPPL